MSSNQVCGEAMMLLDAAKRDGLGDFLFFSAFTLGWWAYASVVTLFVLGGGSYAPLFSVWGLGPWGLSYRIALELATFWLVPVWVGSLLAGFGEKLERGWGEVGLSVRFLVISFPVIFAMDMAAMLAPMA